MKVAIMQPYFLPYLGYYQLIDAVDRIVLLDDVNFIQRGWVNRNRIVAQGRVTWLTIPLEGASQNKTIRDTSIAPDNGWKTRLTRTVTQTYARSPKRDAVLAYWNDWMHEAQGSLSSFLHRTLSDVAEYLDLDTAIIPSSSIFPKNGLKGQDRIIDICVRLGASEYINLPGGSDLYDRTAFEDRGIILKFLLPELHTDGLTHGGADNDALSMLDLMFNNAQHSLRHAARHYGFTTG